MTWSESIGVNPSVDGIPCQGIDIRLPQRPATVYLPYTRSAPSLAHIGIPLDAYRTASPAPASPHWPAMSRLVLHPPSPASPDSTSHSPPECQWRRIEPASQCIQVHKR